MILITGAAGFIGSHLVRHLNDMGRTDLVLCDHLGTEGKWANLQGAVFADFIRPQELTNWVHRWRPIGTENAIVHLGAVTDTGATDGDDVIESNYRLSLNLLNWCTGKTVPFIYASSAATYGDGTLGFRDGYNLNSMRRLRPTNLYGWSKHAFDMTLAARSAAGAHLPAQWIGLKFFNVYGPNEAFKGDMRSVVAKQLADVVADRPVRLFRSYRDDIADGGQKRDFVYVDDVISVIMHFLHIESSDICGLFNVGTGQARTFLDLANAMFSAAGKVPNIEFVDMPEDLKRRYQYFTEANLEKLSQTGYVKNFVRLEDGVKLCLDALVEKQKPLFGGPPFV